MKPLRCLIVEDEPLAIKVLENYVQRIEKLDLIGSCRNALDAFNFLQEESVDILFLDIQMPQMTGINFAKNLTASPRIIFTTAYRNYAVESYELDAVDYLVKPITFERFFKAVNKLFQKEETPAPEISSSFQEVFIYIKSDKKTFKVLLKDILYVESLKDSLVVHTLHQGELLTYQTISHIEKKLPPEKFLRIHRSFIIGLRHLNSFSAVYVHVAGKDLPIGRTYKAVVQQHLEM